MDGANGLESQGRRGPDPFEDGPPTDEQKFRWKHPRSLGFFHIYALIINKMIGTGVYFSPATVFLLTGQKALSISLWIIGFLYSGLSCWLYLDYTVVFPFTGGELVYGSEMTSHMEKPGIEAVPSPLSWTFKKILSKGMYQKWCNFLKAFFGDGTMAHVVYSIVFVCIFNSATNSMRFSSIFLNVVFIEESDISENVKEHLLRLISVVVLSSICLLQMFTPWLGRRLNKMLAVIKILSVFGLIGIGGYAATHRDPNVERVTGNEWTHQYPIKSPHLGWAKALLAVLFSFQGWENATFVAGEIGADRQGKFRLAFGGAILTVGVLYIGVAATFLYAADFDALDLDDTFVAPKLVGNNFGANVAWSVLALISTVGNINAVLYTFSRVKQAIGQANTLPWSFIWKRDYLVHPPREETEGRPSVNVTDYSPQGGLLLHWIGTVTLISASSAIGKLSDAISMPGLLQTYSHAFIQLVLSILFLRLGAREKALGRDDEINTGVWGRLSEQHIIFKVLIIGYIVAMSIAMLVVNALPKTYGLNEEAGAFPGDRFPIILFSIVLGAMAYYYLIFGGSDRVYTTPRLINTELREHQQQNGHTRRVGPRDNTDSLPNSNGETTTVDGTERVESPRRTSTPGSSPAANTPAERRETGPFGTWSLPKIFHIRPIFWIDDAYAIGGEDPMYSTVPLERVVRFGRRWRVIWNIEKSNRPALNQVSVSRRPLGFVYWIFGGRRWFGSKVTMWERMKLKVRNMIGW